MELKEVKPLSVKNYGSIGHLSNSKLGPGDHFMNEGQERILTKKKRDKYDTIFVFEKYDGSNVGIAKKNGQLIPLTRSGYDARNSKFQQHLDFAKWMEEHAGYFETILTEGERIVGEWMGSPVGVKYKCSDYPIVFFDWFTAKNERLPILYLQSTVLPVARLLHYGDPITVEELKPILNLKTESIFCEEEPEGMIYRVERKGKVDFLAKWVRHDFPTGRYLFDNDL